MKVEDRFLHYVTYDTQSDEASSQCPSTPGQKLLAQALVQEMQSIGISDAQMDENGYVYGHLAANVQKTVPAIGLIAHMDTAQEVSGRNVTPKVFRNYQGEALNLGHGVTLEPGEHPVLLSHIGDTLITTDGSTLLGGDDKAGIAEILTAVEQLIKENAPHGDICIAFTPDEEIGRGADRFDLAHFGADFAYTVDGGDPSDVEYENFNAASAEATFVGRSIHPGFCQRQNVKRSAGGHGVSQYAASVRKPCFYRRIRRVFSSDGNAGRCGTGDAALHHQGSQQGAV